MTLAEFNALDLDRRCEAVWEWGFYISRNRTETVTKVLYSLNGFFAEMSIRINDTKIIEVKGFSKNEVIDKPSYDIKTDSPFFKAMSAKLSSSASLKAA
jgi:hypothetical protein